MGSRPLLFVFFLFASIPSASAGFLQFPLRCSDQYCTIDYRTRGAYSKDAITTVLDHSMKRNCSDFNTCYYPYGKLKNGSGDGAIKAFNGESVSGALGGNDPAVCVGGTIFLHPDWDKNVRMTNDAGCGPRFTSYDEHPGYDYKAVYGTPVYAAAAGYVLNTSSGRCYIGNMGGSCSDWGAVAIDHRNGYISQYLHLSAIYVSAGNYVSAGQNIGAVGNKCYGCSIGAHLHFEVRTTLAKIGPETYPIVDPYGWVGYGSDPLYSAMYVLPKNLWK